MNNKDGPELQNWDEKATLFDAKSRRTVYEVELPSRKCGETGRFLF